MVVILAWAKSCSDRQLVLGPKLSLKPLELWSGSRAGEIVTMDADHDLTLSVGKHTCRRRALHKPELNQ